MNRQTGWRSTFTSVFEGVIVVDLSHFEVERILPLGVLIGGINLEGVFTAVRQEDAKLITGSIALSLEFVMTLHSGKEDGARCDALEGFPARDVEEVMVLRILGAGDGIGLGHDREGFEDLRTILPVDEDIVGGTFVATVVG
jgi:hypothetical protein